jgi:nucleoside 2-deoxyribosyltransferase
MNVPSAKLRVFVAMRIGEPETDKLYRKAIRPAVRACGLTPIRIDAIDYNDDIDDRIIDEIGKAGVLIADLTFARPSVYFEGGYAAGLGKPVIYTARRDHFRDKDDDPLGNLRVHFDLQMKNIIDWSSPDSGKFRQRLERRLRLVVQPILKKRQAESSELVARMEFQRMPVARRLESVTNRVETALGTAGGAVVRLGVSSGFQYSYSTVLMPGRVPEGLLYEGSVAHFTSPGILRRVWARVDETTTLAELRPLDEVFATAPPLDANLPRRSRPNRVTDHLVLVSLRRLPTPRIQSAFRSYEQLDEGLFRSHMRRLLPTSRVRDEILLIGRTPYGRWQGIGLERGDEFSGETRHYEAKDGYLRSPEPWSASILSRTRQAPKPELETHARVKEVPCRAYLHVIDGVESLSAGDRRVKVRGSRFKQLP